MPSSRLIRTLIAPFAAAAFAATAHAQFADGGYKNTTPDTAWVDAARADSTVAPDGRIVVAETMASVQYGAAHVLVRRLLPDGRDDASFGNDGAVEIDAHTPWSERNNATIASRVVVLRSGDIIVAGYTARTYAMWQDGYLIKLHADGTLDTSFGDAGRVILPSPVAVPWYDVFSLSEDAQSRLFVAESMQVGSKVTVEMFRLDANGQPDASYGTNGMSHVSLQGIATPRTLLIDPNGGYFVVRAHYDAGNPEQTTVVRLDSDGLVDHTWGHGSNDGAVVTGLMSFGQAAFGSDGTIVIGGRSHLHPTVAAIRTSDGALDDRFGDGGLAVATASPVVFGTSATVLFAPDPSGGYIVEDLMASRPYDLLAAKFTATGRPDPSFGDNGLARHPSSFAVDALEGHVDTEGKLLGLYHGWDPRDGSTQHRAYYLRRLRPDGSVDE